MIEGADGGALIGEDDAVGWGDSKAGAEDEARENLRHTQENHQRGNDGDSPRPSPANRLQRLNSDCVWVCRSGHKPELMLPARCQGLASRQEQTMHARILSRRITVRPTFRGPLGKLL
jgi:hypothetical protein